jgi:hypothetical protein
MVPTSASRGTLDAIFYWSSNMRKIFNLLLLPIVLLNCNSQEKLLSKLEETKNDFILILYENDISSSVDPEGMIFKDSLGKVMSDTGIGFA